MSAKGPFGIIDLHAVAVPTTTVAADMLSSPSLILELPLPPSVNRTSGLRLGNEHQDVKAWRKSADAHLIYTRQSRHLRAIAGEVVIEISWATQMLGDIDNRIKHLLDYLQRLRVVENDSRCRELHVRYSGAHVGCRVRVRPWEWQG